ncbi:hypothetical protein KSNIM_25695 [Kitasatospora sp. DSM 101779]|nr:hypothetical protein [Kitasatospora sp. DSM 101779]
MGRQQRPLGPLPRIPPGLASHPARGTSPTSDGSAARGRLFRETEQRGDLVHRQVAGLQVPTRGVADAATVDTAWKIGTGAIVDPFEMIDRIGLGPAHAIATAMPDGRGRRSPVTSRPSAWPRARSAWNPVRAYTRTDRPAHDGTGYRAAALPERYGDHESLRRWECADVPAFRREPGCRHVRSRSSPNHRPAPGKQCSLSAQHLSRHQWRCPPFSAGSSRPPRRTPRSRSTPTPTATPSASSSTSTPATPARTR